MATEPPPFITFRTDRSERVPVYELALELSRQLFTIIELVEGVERIHLRDKLDRRSTEVPVLIAKAMATPDMARRRDLFETARIYTTECEAILDVLHQRATVEDEVITPALETSRKLRDQLAALAVPPPRVY